MKGRARTTALLVATAIGGAACVGAPREERVGESAEPIIGGSVDTADTAVVAVVQPGNGTLCSGTVIAPGIVLTAAHCVYGVDASALQVLVGSDSTKPDQTVAVTSAVAYPTYVGESTGLAGGVDLGVVYLATPLAVAPVALRTGATDAELAGASVTLVGYGVSSTTDSTMVGVRREVSVTVAGVCTRVLTLGNADANECSGDSGGAVLLGGELVAVISSGSPDCIAPSNQTRLGGHAPWLEAVLHGDAGASCPECVEPDPSCTALVEGESAGVDGAPDGAGGGGGGGHGGGCAVVRGRAAPAGDFGGLFAASWLVCFAVGRRSRA